MANGKDRAMEGLELYMELLKNGLSMKQAAAMAAGLVNMPSNEETKTPPAELVKTAPPPVEPPAKKVETAPANQLGPTGKTVPLPAAKPKAEPPKMVDVQCAHEENGSICQNMVKIEEKFSTKVIDGKTVPSKVFCNELHRKPCPQCGQLRPVTYKFCKRCRPGTVAVATVPVAPRRVAPKPSMPKAPKVPQPCKGWYKAPNGNRIDCTNLTLDYNQICDGCRIPCKGGCGKPVPHWFGYCKNCHDKSAPSPVLDQNIGVPIALAPEGPNEGVRVMACWANDTSTGRRNSNKKCGAPTEHSTNLCAAHRHACNGGCGREIPAWWSYCNKECKAKKYEARNNPPVPKAPTLAEIAKANEEKAKAEVEATRRDTMGNEVLFRLSWFVEADLAIKMANRVMKKHGDEGSAKEALMKVAVNKQLDPGAGDAVDETTWVYAQAAEIPSQEKFLELVAAKRQQLVNEANKIREGKKFSVAQSDQPKSSKKEGGKKGGKNGKNHKRGQQHQQ